MKSFLCVFGAVPLLVLSLMAGCLTEEEASQIESAESALGAAFVAHLTGADEVPPVGTAAVGQAAVAVTPNNVLHALSVGNIVDVGAAHIHCAPEGVNGPVGITLFLGGPVGSGNLANGPLPDPDPGNACGWVTLDDAIAAMEAGNAYVNVHTVANPGGEVRGQLR